MRTVPDKLATKLLGAADLIAERGLDDTKTEDIVVATGIPKATLYYYFAGKEEILAFLFDAVLAEVERVVTAAADGPGNAAERLRRVIEAHLGVFASHPMPSRALQFDLGRAARLPEIAARSNAAFIRPVSALLAEGAKDGSLRAVDHPQMSAVVLLGAVTTAGGNIVAMEPGGSKGRTASDVADIVASIVLDGLVPRSAPRRAKR